MERNEDALQTLYKRLDKNMAEFDAGFEGLSKAEIAEIKEVTSTREIYNFIRNEYDSPFEPREAELLLRMENPLQFIVDHWPCNDLEAQAKEYLAGEAGKETLPQPSHEAKDTAERKPSVLKQIKANQREVNQRSIAPDRPKGGEAR